MSKLAIVPLLLLAACASEPLHTVQVPDRLRPGANESLAFVLPAQGFQIYECRAKKDQAGAYEWAFVAPEAQLYDTRGTLFGKHYAGPHWESNDGSKVLGSVKERADAPSAGAIPWLLLGAKSVGSDGALGKVTSIQRVNTVGGGAPAGGCSQATVGAPARVGYTADYHFFTA